MASGNSRVVSGSYVGTGAAQYIRYDKVGFRPKRITVYRNETAIDMCEHIQGMADASMFQTIGTTGVRTLVTTEGITLQDQGFLLGTDAQVNAAAGVFLFVAEE